MSKQVAAVGGGCLGLLLLVVLVTLLGGLFWGWLLMLCLGAAHATSPSWGFWHCVFPWGLVAGFVFGAIRGSRSRS